MGSAPWSLGKVRPGPSDCVVWGGAEGGGQADQCSPPWLPDVQPPSSMQPSAVIWKCRKWDYPGTDVHKRGEMEVVPWRPPLIVSEAPAASPPSGPVDPAGALPGASLKLN